MSFIEAEQARLDREELYALRNPVQLEHCGLCGNRHYMDTRTKMFIGGCKNPVEVGPLYVAETEAEMGNSFERARR